MTVVVVSTRYDRATRTTHQWAKNFVVALNQIGFHAVTLYASGVNAVSLQQSLCGADVLVFFGHGEPDRLIGQRSRLWIGSGPTLVDVSTVNLLSNVKVYAVCCQASLQLGKAYAAAAPAGAFLGYEAPFGLSYPNAALFEREVIFGGLDFVYGKNPPSSVASNLRQRWKRLSDQFLNGKLQNSHDHFLAGYAAATNALFVALTP